MDPKETLKLLLLALLAGKRDEAIEHADNLANWLSRDGFIPQLDGAFFTDIAFGDASPRLLIHEHEFGETYHPFYFRPGKGRDERYPDIYKIFPRVLGNVPFEPKKEERLRLDSLVEKPLLLLTGEEYGAAGMIDEIGPEDPDEEDLNGEE